MKKDCSTLQELKTATSNYANEKAKNFSDFRKELYDKEKEQQIKLEKKVNKESLFRLTNATVAKRIGKIYDKDITGHNNQLL